MSHTQSACRHTLSVRDWERVTGHYSNAVCAQSFPKANRMLNALFACYSLSQYWADACSIMISLPG